MRAIRMSETGSPEVLQNVEVEDPIPGAGEVLIQVQSASVNFSDITRRKGDRFTDPTPLPYIPGVEVAGTIAALGDGVSGIPIGTPVFGVAGPSGSGGYAELAVASQANVIPLPPGLNPDLAASMLTVGLTATLLLTEATRLAASESVFIPAAAGGLGGYAVQIANALNAGTVIAGASTPAKRDIALDLGAHHAVDYRQSGWTDEVRRLTGGNGVDVALEMVGPRHFGETIGALAPFGRIVVYGAVQGLAEEVHFDGPALESLVYDPAPNQSIAGFNLGVWFALRPQQTTAAIGRLMGWIADGTISGPKISPMPLAEAAEAHRLVESGEATGKLILKP